MHNPYLARLVALCSAIEHAEGFWVPNARPRRNNNPGDLVGDGAVDHSFGTRLQGFDALAWKVARILAGQSTVYALTSSWLEFAERWTGGDNAAAWCESVCDDLDVYGESTLDGWLARVDRPYPEQQAPPPQPAPAPEQS